MTNCLSPLFAECVRQGVEVGGRGVNCVLGQWSLCPSSVPSRSLSLTSPLSWGPNLVKVGLFPPWGGGEWTVLRRLGASPFGVSSSPVVSAPREKKLAWLDNRKGPWA